MHPPISRFGRSRMEDCVASAAAAIAGNCDRPYALFGHSMGALIGFLVAARLELTLGCAPRYVFVSAASPSGLRAPIYDRPVFQLPHDEFWAAIRHFNSTPEELLADPALLRLVEPVLHADLELMKTARWNPQLRTSCPILALRPSRDLLSDEQTVQAWECHTTDRFEHLLVEGDHFFIIPQRRAVLDLVLDRLSRVLGSDGDSPACAETGGRP